MTADSTREATDGRRRLGNASGFGAILLWSTTVALARSLSEQVGPLTASAAVYVLAGLISLAHFALLPSRVRELSGLRPAYLAGCGALFVSYMLALFLGLGRAEDDSQAIQVGLLNYLWPALTILFSLVLLKQQATWLLVPATVLSVFGVFCVLGNPQQFTWASWLQGVSRNPSAYMFGLAAAVLWALYSNLTRRWAGGGQSGAVDLFLILAGITLLALSRAMPEAGSWTGRAATEAAVLGTVTWIAYGLWDFAMRHGDVVRVAVLSYFTPFLSTLVSCLYLRVAPGITLWTGCGLIIAGSLLTWFAVERPGKG